MYMEHSFSRLEELFSQLDYNNPPVLCACCSGISLVYSKLKDILDIITLDEGEGLKRLKALTDLNPTIYGSDDSMREKIAEVLGAKYGEYYLGELDEVIYLAGLEEQLLLLPEQIRLDETDTPLTREMLKAISYIIKSYKFAGLLEISSGSGFTFDRWEDMHFTFDELDYMEFEFRFTENFY